MDFSIVAFLDILGFSAMVRADATAAEPVHLPRLKEAMKLIRGKPVAKEFEVRAFSDSIVVSGPLGPHQAVNLLETVVLLQRELLARGILVRGGVALGKHHSDDDIIFSEALIAAYILERDEARYPRILVDQRNLLDWLRNHRDITHEDRERLRRMTCRDRDRRIFISYLDAAWLGDHRKIVEDYLGRTNLAQDTILEKARWLVDYHQHIAKREGVSPEIVGAPSWSFTDGP